MVFYDFRKIHRRCCFTLIKSNVLQIKINPQNFILCFSLKSLSKMGMEKFRFKSEMKIFKKETAIILEF